MGSTSDSGSTHLLVLPLVLLPASRELLGAQPHFFTSWRFRLGAGVARHGAGGSLCSIGPAAVRSWRGLCFVDVFPPNRDGICGSPTQGLPRAPLC